MKKSGYQEKNFAIAIVAQDQKRFSTCVHTAIATQQSALREEIIEKHFSQSVFSLFKIFSGCSSLEARASGIVHFVVDITKEVQTSANSMLQETNNGLCWILDNRDYA